MWAEIGVTIEIQGLDANALTSVCCPAFDYDVMLWGWGSDPDPAFLLGVAICDEVPSGLSETGYCNPDYDDLYVAQGSETDQAAGSTWWHHMQQFSSPRGLHDPVLPETVEAYRTDPSRLGADRDAGREGPDLARLRRVQ